MSCVLGPPGYNCFRRDKLERVGEGDQDKILKINKVCVCSCNSQE